MSTLMRWLCLLAAATLAVGCGYALVGRASNLPSHVKSVHLSTLENQTRRSQVDQILTRALSEELVTRRRFEIVDSEEAADAVLDGAILRFDLTPINFDAEGRATEYQITINVRVRFFDRAEEAVLWSNDRYVYKESYPVDTSSADYFDQEQQAIEEAAEQFARNMVIDLLEGF